MTHDISTLVAGTARVSQIRWSVYKVQSYVRSEATVDIYFAGVMHHPLKTLPLCKMPHLANVCCVLHSLSGPQYKLLYDMDATIQDFGRCMLRLARSSTHMWLSSASGAGHNRLQLSQQSVAVTMSASRSDNEFSSVVC